MTTSLLVGGAGLLLYLATLAPTVLWGDDAELQRIVVTGEQRTIGQSSQASHLLWLAVAGAVVRGAPWLPLDAAGRTTLVSALGATVTLVLVALAGGELGRPWLRRPWLVGLLAAGALGVSHTFWLFAVRPAVYTLSTALLALAIWVTLRWRAAGRPVWLAVGVGAMVLSLTNHVLALASGPGLATLAVAVPAGRRRALLLAAGGAAVAGGGLLALAGVLGFPLGELVRAGAGYRPALPPLREVALIPAFLLYQFPLALSLAAWGALRLGRADPGALAGLLVLYAGNLLLISLHHPPGIVLRDRFLYYLPSYLPVALLVGVGGAALVERVTGRTALVGALVAGLVLAPVAVYPLAAVAAGEVATRLSPARTLPGRDPVAFYLLPGKGGYTGARRYGEEALATLAPNAAVLADWLPYQTLLYLQRVEGRRPDVLLAQINAGTGAQLAFLLEHAGRRPLYLADASPPPYYDLAEIERCFTVRGDGPVFRAERRPSGTVAGCG